MVATAQSVKTKKRAVNIAITSPAGFEFQDLVCLELMLRHVGNTTAQFFVEIEGGEDTRLILTKGSKTIRFEIQSKNETAAVTTKRLVNLMSHCSVRGSPESLFDRLIVDGSSVAIFYTGGRCADDLVGNMVTRDWEVADFESRAVAQSFAKSFIAAFCAKPAKRKKLTAVEKKRYEKRLSLETTPERDIFGALGRIGLVEQTTKDSITSKCSEILRRLHRVPEDRVESVLAALKTVIVEAKGTGMDAFPRFREVLKSKTVPRLKADDYVLRGDEQEFIDRVSSDLALLITGGMRVGKSSLARFVGTAFQEMGFNALLTGDADTAMRFLGEPDESLRLAILEDPLGAVRTLPDAAYTLERIATTLNRISQTRRLIVVQATPQLLATADATRISQLRSASHEWIELLDSETAFSLTLWEQISASFSVREDLRLLVRSAITEGRLKLEAGCIVHLAANTANIKETTSIQAISRIARQSSSALGMALVEEGAAPFLSAMAVLSTSAEPMTVARLKLVNDVDDLKRAVEFASAQEIANAKIGLLPDRRVKPCTTKFDGALEKLESKRYISYLSDLIEFVHPFYRAAAESVVTNTTHAGSLRILALIQTGLFAKDAFTSRATAKYLTWIYDKCSIFRDTREKLVASAMAGMRSMFPATRDICFDFLLENIEALSAGIQTLLPRWVEAVTAASLEGLTWNDGAARFDDARSRSASSFKYYSAQPPKDVLSEIDNLDSENYVRPSPERAALVLLYLKRAPHLQTKRMTERLRTFDEAIFRAQAARVLLSISRESDDALLPESFQDRNPVVARAVLKGAVAGWNACNPARRDVILSGLLRLAQTPSSAIAMIDFLVLFGRVDQTGPETPWIVFGRLLPEVLRSIPNSTNTFDHRLLGACESSIKHLDATLISDICTAWINWSERLANAGETQNEFKLGIASFVLTGLASRPELRTGLLERLFAPSGNRCAIRFRRRHGRRVGYPHRRGA